MQTLTKIGNKNYKIDLTTQRIDFLDNRFYFDVEGKAVPSVTTILEAYPKGAAFYDWLKKHGEDSDQIRDDAGNRGSTVHSLTEQYDNGDEVTLLDLDRIGYRLSEWAMFERYVEFRDRFPLDIIHTELTLVSSALGFAGTLDRVIEMEGKKILVDIKTSGSVWPSYWLQLAAYRQLLKENDIEVDEVAILWLNAKTRSDGKKGTCQGTGWQLITREAVESEKDWKLFRATQQLWLAENGSQQPRQLSYCLKHQLSKAV